MGIRDLIVWKPKLCLALGAVCIVITAVVVVLVLFAFKNDCSKAPDLPSSINFYIEDEDVVVSWQDSLSLQPKCEESFLLRYAVNGGEEIEVTTTDLSHTILQIPLCSDVILNLWTVSETGSPSDESLEGRYTAIPRNLHVTNLETALTPAGVQVSWQRPTELSSCDTSYSVKYSSELGDFFDQTDEENIIIPDEVFCLSVTIFVAIVVGYTQTVDGLTSFINPRDLNVKATIPNLNDPYMMTVTWSHPNEALCSLKYKIQYNLPEARTFEVEEPRLHVNIYYCLPGIIIITPMRLDGTDVGVVTIEYITQSPHPSIINKVSSIYVTRRTDALIVRWFETPGIMDCSFVYRIEYTTEMDTFTDFSTEADYEIPRTQFCFNLEIEVRGVVDGIYGEPTTRSYQYPIVAVEELQWEEDAEDDTLVATWTTDKWQEQCELEYVVTYRHGSITKSLSTYQKRATFIKSYCAVTSVSVKITYNEAESPENVIFYTGGYPSSIPPVENVKFIESGTSVNVSWDVNESISQCFLSFTVTGKDDSWGAEALCEGVESCEVPLDDFCQFTEFTIASITSLEETPYVTRYSCSSSN